MGTRQFMRSIIRVGLMLALVAGGWCLFHTSILVPAPAYGFTLKVSVVDEQGGSVNDALVSIRNQKFIENNVIQTPFGSARVAGGVAVFQGLPAGHYSFDVAAEGFADPGIMILLQQDTELTLVLRSDKLVNFRGRILFLRYDEEYYDENSVIITNPRAAVPTETMATLCEFSLNSRCYSYGISTEWDGTFSVDVPPGEYEIILQTPNVHFSISPHWKISIDPYFHATILITDSAPVILPFTMNDTTWKSCGYHESSQRVDPVTYAPIP